jgi:PRC-barrel domain
MEVKMLNKLLITTAVSSVIISGAIAQPERQTAPGPREQSGAQSGAGESSAASGTKFIASQGADQWTFTKLRGSDVRGPDDASVGSVNDLLFDKSGKIIGVVIGMGGFLGIGAKNVAIGMSALNVVPADPGNNEISTSAASDPSNVRLKVSWTKEQLQDAPDFQYYKPPARPVSPPATTGVAPQPTAPARPRPQTQ